MKYLIILFFFFNNAYALVGHKDLAAIKTGSMIEVKSPKVRPVTKSQMDFVLSSIRYLDQKLMEEMMLI